MSGFVAGGTNDAPTERDEAWLKAQQEIEARRLAKIDAGKQEGGKSLYETLQANKDAKQEAFEESIRLKNQFRTLDEDEVEFLDSVLESTRAKEAETRRETKQQLDAFRLRQEEAENASKQNAGAEEPVESEAWTTTSRKRKKQTEHARSIRKRPSGATKAEADPAPVTETMSQTVTKEPMASIGTQKDTRTIGQTSTPKQDAVSKPPLGLSGYSSSEEDDE